MTALFYGLVVLVFNRNASGLWLMMLGWFGLNANWGQSQMMFALMISRCPMPQGAASAFWSPTRLFGG